MNSSSVNLKCNQRAPDQPNHIQKVQPWDKRFTILQITEEIQLGPFRQVNDSLKGHICSARAPDSLQTLFVTELICSFQGWVGNKAWSQLLWLTYACIIDFSHTNTLVQLHAKSTLAVKHKVCAALRR